MKPICSKCGILCDPVNINIELDPNILMICTYCRQVKCFGILTAETLRKAAVNRSGTATWEEWNDALEPLFEAKQRSLVL